MKNSLTDVKNHLIEAMERLNDDEFVSDKETLEKEIQKAGALSNLAEQVVNIHQVEINAMKVANECGLLYKPKGMELIYKPKGMELKELPSNEKRQGRKIGEFGEYED